MISVIVPVYNTGKYLRRCLDSLRNQTYEQFEVIMVDDGSTDDSGAICDEYAVTDPRFKAIHKPNGGVSSARNVGLKSIQGQWVTFVDSDDYVLETFLEDYIRYFDDNADIYVQGYVDRNGNGEEIALSRAIKSFSDGLIDSIYERRLNLYSYVYNKAFRTDLIKENDISFDENITMAEDSLFVTKYMKLVHIASHLPHANYIYEMTEGSASLKIHTAESWIRWFRAYYELYIPYMKIDARFANNEFKRLWNRFIDALNDKYFYDGTKSDRLKMIKALKNTKPRPFGMSDLSTKGIITWAIVNLPPNFVDLTLKTLANSKNTGRNERIKKEKRRLKDADIIMTKKRI